MDKAQFIKAAPLYYAIAIVQYLLENNAIEASSTAIQERFNDSDDPDDKPSLPFIPFFEEAVRVLVTKGVIDALDDPFGPQMLFRANDFSENLTRLAEDQASPFHRFRRMARPLPWLIEALAAVERARCRLQVEASDMEIDEWAPLELDRSEPELIGVIGAVDEVIETVRGDNRYAENMPLEREFTLQSLAAFSTTLKEAAVTSVPYIRRHAIEPLSLLGKRFAKGAFELTVAAAKEALKTWLKKHGLDWLNDWWT